MSEEETVKRLREAEMKLMLLEEKVKNQGETIKTYTSGIGRVFWIIGTVSISSAVAWVIGGGLK